MDRIKLLFWKWRCSRLKDPIIPLLPHKTDGTRLTELEMYRLAWELNKSNKPRVYK